MFADERKTQECNFKLIEFSAKADPAYHMERAYWKKYKRSHTTALTMNFTAAKATTTSRRFYFSEVLAACSGFFGIIKKKSITAGLVWVWGRREEAKKKKRKYFIGFRFRRMGRGVYTQRAENTTRKVRQYSTVIMPSRREVNFDVYIRGGFINFLDFYCCTAPASYALQICVPIALRSAIKCSILDAHGWGGEARWKVTFIAKASSAHADFDSLVESN